jgi:hypothetical protein
MARLDGSTNAHRRRERGQIEEGELVRRIAAPASAVATMQICGFRAMMVRRAERVSGARWHAHRCVRRSRAVHGARRYNEEKSAVEHEPESDQRTQHASSDRTAHHASKVRSGIERVQKRAAGSGQQVVFPGSLTQQVLLIY